MTKKTQKPTPAHMQKLADLMDTRPEGVTARWVQSALSVSPTLAKAAPIEIGATEVEGKWVFDEVEQSGNAGELEPVQSGSIPALKSETGIPVSEQKQSVKPETVSGDTGLKTGEMEPTAIPDNAPDLVQHEVDWSVAPAKATHALNDRFLMKQRGFWFEWIVSGWSMFYGVVDESSLICRPVPEPLQPAPAPQIKAPKVKQSTQMINLFEEHPEGVTKEQAMELLGLELPNFKAVLQRVREDVTVDLIERDGKKLYVMRDDLVPAPAPAPKEIEMQQPEQVQPQPVVKPVEAQPERVEQLTDIEGWVFIDKSGTFKTAPRPSAAQAIAAMELLGQREIDELIKAQGLRLVKVRVVTDVLFAMGECA